MRDKTELSEEKEEYSDSAAEKVASFEPMAIKCRGQKEEQKSVI